MPISFTVMPHEVPMAVKAITQFIPHAVRTSASQPTPAYPRLIYDGVSQLTAADDIADQVQSILTGDWRAVGLKLVLHETTDKIRTRHENVNIRVGRNTVATDVASRHLLMELYHLSQMDPGKTWHWKYPDGTVTTVDDSQIARMAQAASTHAQICLRTASQVRDAVEVGSIVNEQQIIDAFAVINTTY